MDNTLMICRALLLAVASSSMALNAQAQEPANPAPTAPTTQPADAAQQNPNWPAGFALHVKLTVTQSANPQRIRWPLVAVYILDQQNKPVRTLALWADRPQFWRFLPNWWKITGSKLKPAYLEKISQAPHKPGDYELLWDGKDDAGQFAKAGIYTVALESYLDRELGHTMALTLKCIDAENHIETTGPGGVSSAGAVFKKSP